MEQEWVSYIIVLSALLTIGILLVVRIILSKNVQEEILTIGNGQTIGRRSEQDDYFSTATTNIGTIAVLADGISGLSNGRMASTAAVTTFLNEFLRMEKFANIISFFKATALKSNEIIVQNLQGSNGGTTIVAAIIDKNGYLHWGAVGDSVVSILRNKELLPINQKHIFENVLKERFLTGEISEEEMHVNSMKKRLINYLGYEGFKNIEVCKEPIKLNRGDKVCLYSDGVYNSLTEVELEQILSQKIPPHHLAQKVIKAVEQKRLKKQDNATIVILEKKW